MKNTKVIVLVLVIVIVSVVGGIVWQTLINRQAPVLAPPSTGPGQVQQQTAQKQLQIPPPPTVIAYTDQGFSPASVTIKKGGAVVWKNESAKNMWPASALHPTHTVYPGSGIQKCNTAEQPNIFDACAPISPGNSWSFKFLQLGSWKFHDHLFPTKFGTINVE